MSDTKQKFKVVLRNRNMPSETIDADYFVLDGGALFFRRIGGPNKYPVAVKVFASGTWISVESLSVASPT